jgi:hypothetical protein
MNASNDLDRRLDDLLVEGPSTAPDRAIGTALEHARRHPRRPDPLFILRRDPMASAGAASVRRVVTLVAAAALLIAVAVAAASVGGVFERRAVIVPVPSASPSAPVAPSASPPASPSPTASATPSASASPAAIRVDLPDENGGSAFVEITDLSGTLTSARAGQTSEGSEPSGDIGVANLAGDPASVVLTWVGCPSDTRHVLTIASAGRAMTLDQPVCTGDTLGVERVLVLTFPDPTPASEVHVTVDRSGG